MKIQDKTIEEVAKVENRHKQELTYCSICDCNCSCHPCSHTPNYDNLTPAELQILEIKESIKE